MQAPSNQLKDLAALMEAKLPSSYHDAQVTSDEALIPVVSLPEVWPAQFGAQEMQPSTDAQGREQAQRLDRG